MFFESNGFLVRMAAGIQMRFSAKLYTHEGNKKSHQIISDLARMDVKFAFCI